MKIFQNKDIGFLLLRLAVGVLMLLHGIHKLLNFSGSIGFIQSLLDAKGLPGFLSYGVIVGEVLAPLLIILGLRTKLSALVLASNCLVIIALAHLQDVFSLTVHGGWAIELVGLYLFGSLALAFTGGGKYSVSTQNKWD